MGALTTIEKTTDIEALRALAHTQQNEISNLKMQLLLRDERIAGLVRDAFARTSEKLSRGEHPGEPTLFDEAEYVVHESMNTKPEEEALTVVASHVRRRGKRARLPEYLPRIEEIIDIPDESKFCSCGAPLIRIGEDISEKLEVIPMQFRVRKTIRPRYACSAGKKEHGESAGRVIVAPVPPAILPKTNTTPSLLATLVTWKFQDALPLFRQEKIFSRNGIELTRATMSRWILDLGEKCRPIADGIEALIRAGPFMGMDETPTKVFGEEGRPDIRTSYMWVARGGIAEKKGVVFRYHPERSDKLPAEFLAGYEGVLQSDGYDVYDKVVKGTAIIHVGCMAHARRRFIMAKKSGKILCSADAAIDYIKRLYKIEREADELKLSDDQRVVYRKENAVPILIAFHAWCEEKSMAVPPESLIGKAVSYSLSQWNKLIRYIDYGFVSPDNNMLENAIRPFVIGRKNFMFSGSPDGAKASAILYSIIETAKANGHEPFQYLYYLFSLLPMARTQADSEVLLPFNVSPASVRAFVSANWLGVVL
jgi:transposase